jgi:GAF domain-containing protein/HAMP domain-containing protein
VVVLAAGAVLVARQIARPVFAITNIARRVAAGDFSGAAPVLTQDEIGTLARTFNQMTEQLQSLYMGLEEKVAERTRELERRAVQLQAAAEVGSAVATVRNLDDLLSQVTRLIADRFGFYHVGIFLLDEKREFAVLRAANSEGGQRMLKRGHKLGIGQKGIVGFATGARQPRIAMDVGQDAVFFDNPDLPATRSEMALPLVAAGELLGALDVQSTQEAAFSTEDITTLQVLANQVAVAIENANLFAQNQAALAEIQAALETSRRAYGEVSHQAWENILRARPELGYRCTAEEHVEAAIGTWQAEMLQAQQRAQTIQVDDQTLIIPVKIRDNVAGAVKLRKTGQAGAWREEERQLIVNLVDQMGVALESSRLYDNAQRTAERERLTSEITARMRASLDIEAVLQTAARELGQALNAALEIHLGTDYRAQAEVSPAVPDNGHQGT